MAILETVKELANLANKVGNLELSKQIVEVQTELLAVVQQNHALEEEVRELKKRLATREQLTFSKNAYWLPGDDGPFCSSCYDQKGQLVRLHIASAGAPSSPQCPACGHYAVDPDKQRSAVQRMHEGRTGRGPEPRGGY